MARAVKPDIKQSSPQAGDNRLRVISEEIKTFFGHYKKARKETFEHIAKVGGRLNEAREIVGHGRWAQWFKDNKFPFNIRTAGDYRTFADGVADGFIKYEKFADLGIVACVDAYKDELATRKLRKAGVFGRRQRKGRRPLRPKTRPPGRFKNRKRGHFDDGTIPSLKPGQVFRMEWNPKRGGESSVVYVWPDAHHFHSIFLRYKLDGTGIPSIGEHETNDRKSESRSDLTERLAHWAAEGLDSMGKPIAPDVTTEEWYADQTTRQLLQEWQRSIEIAQKEIRIARRVDLRAAASKEGLVKPSIKKASPRDK